MLLAAFFFSITAACVKLVINTIHFWEVVFARSFLGLLFLFPTLYQAGVASLIGNRRKILLLRGISGFFGLALYFYAISAVPLSTATLLVHTSPLWVLFLSIFFLNEKNHRFNIIAILLAFLGIILIIKPGTVHMSWALILGLFSGISAGIAYTSIRSLGKTEHPATIVFYFCFISSIISAILMLPKFQMPNFSQFLALLGVGLFSTLGQYIMTLAYKYERAAVISPFNYVSVVLNFLLGLFFWDEILDIYSVMGCILVIFSGTLIAHFAAVPYEKPKSHVEKAFMLP